MAPWTSSPILPSAASANRLTHRSTKHRCTTARCPLSSRSCRPGAAVRGHPRGGCGAGRDGAAVMVIGVEAGTARPFPRQSRVGGVGPALVRGCGRRRCVDGRVRHVGAFVSPTDVGARVPSRTPTHFPLWRGRRGRSVSRARTRTRSGSPRAAAVQAARVWRGALVGSIRPGPIGVVLECPDSSPRRGRRRERPGAASCVAGP